MFLIFNLLLFVCTVAIGGLPLWRRNLQQLAPHKMQLLLTFTGSFLLSITFLHLLPESFAELHTHGYNHSHEPGHSHDGLALGAGFYMLLGFLLQLLIQHFTHGAEHGHVHLPHETPNGHHHHLPVAGIVAGLSVHAFMEGLPLGFQYQDQVTTPALYLAIAGHKLPEAMVLTILVLQAKGRKAALLALISFALLTPLASSLALYAGTHYETMHRLVTILIPVVAGAFIHIATTIFFESGNSRHQLPLRRVGAMLAGCILGLLTLFFH